MTTRIKYGTEDNEWFEVRMVDHNNEGVPCTPHVVLVDGSYEPDQWVLSVDEAAALGAALKTTSGAALRICFERMRIVSR